MRTIYSLIVTTTAITAIAALSTFSTPAATAQTKDSDSKTTKPLLVQHGDPEKALAEARKDVKNFNEAFVQLTKMQSLPVAVKWMYADDFVYVGIDGKKLTKGEFLQSGKITTESVRKDELKSEGGKQVDLKDSDRFWRPDRYEVNGREITVYVSPVTKTKQLVPAPDGGTKLGEVKVLGTDKQIFVKQDNGLLKLKREEMLGIKILVDGKPLPPEALASGAKPDNTPQH